MEVIPEGSQKITTLIGYRWKCSDVWSQVVLITRQLPFLFYNALLCYTCFYSSNTLLQLSFFTKDISEKFNVNFMSNAHTKDNGGYSVGVPPLPIPNREVKPYSATFFFSYTEIKQRISKWVFAIFFAYNKGKNRINYYWFVNYILYICSRLAYLAWQLSWLERSIHNAEVGSSSLPHATKVLTIYL